MINKIYKIFFPLIFLVPFISYADEKALDKTGKIFGSVKYIVTDILVPLAFTLALVFFFWGVAQYILKSGSEKDEGKKIMVWGVIALFVMSSVWGIVSMLQGELLIGNKTDGTIPTIK
jgi:hypothetical protein